MRIRGWIYRMYIHTINIYIMTLKELNNNFKNGDIDFNSVEKYIVEDNSYTTHRDFNTSINIGRAQKEGFEEITYIGEAGHLNFKYRYDNGSLIPESVYIKTDEELESEAREDLKAIGIVMESKVLKFNEFK